MIGRLIKKQNVRTLKQGSGKIEAHLPAAGEVPDRTREVFLAKSQTDENFRSARFGRIGLNQPQTFHNFRQVFRPGILLQPPQFRQFPVFAENVFQNRLLQVFFFYFLFDKSFGAVWGTQNFPGVDVVLSF